MSIPSTGYTIAGAATSSTAPLAVQATQADLAADYIPLYSSSTMGTVAINIENLLGIGSQVMAIGDTQTVSAKTFDNTNVYLPKDTSFTFQSALGSTKRAQFSLSSITAGQTRIFTLPNYNGTLATIGGVEILTNKTFTAPVITNASITSDNYAGFSDVDSGTVLGISVTNGAIGVNAHSLSSVDSITAETSSHLALSAGTSKLVKTTVLRQDNITNTYQPGNTVTLTGWGYLVPGVSPSANETVSFGIAFAQKPIVTATYGGDNASATTYGSGAINIKDSVLVSANSITNANFVLSIETRDNSNYAAGNTVFYQWIAVGEI